MLRNWIGKLFGFDIEVGRLRIVENKGPYRSANKDYYKVKIQHNVNGTNELGVKYLLLTEYEYNQAIDRANKNLEDL